jgi:metal-sulfur cluster biosynthetic enzyme
MHVHPQSDAADVVLDALRHVVEPHLGINIVDLGLVYSVHAVGETVRVELGVVMPQDIETAELEGRVRRTIQRRLPQFRRLELLITRDRMWHPGRMSDQARRWLGL